MNLSEQLPRVREVVARIEDSLDKEFSAKGVREQNPNTDILVIGGLQMHAAADEGGAQPIAAAGDESVR